MQQKQEKTFDVTKFENVTVLLANPNLYIAISSHLNGQLKQIPSICELEKTEVFSVFKRKPET